LFTYVPAPELFARGILYEAGRAMVAGTADHPGYKNASGVFTMPTTSLIFGGDVITNIPTNSNLSLTSIAPTASDFIFNYGAAASVSAAAGSATVSITLQLSTGSGGTKNSETLFAGGSSAIFVGGSTNIVFTGTAAQATAFLDNAYVVDNTNNDSFKIKILAADQPGTGTGNISIAYTTACFVTGTRIATPDGEVAVESLAAGNMVTTQEGDRRVAWIGTRTYEADMLRAEPWLRPVEIRRGALGRGLPRRDLLVSPEHAMLVDGVLVRASALVNGRTIFHAAITGDVTYFHVELENEHGILFAEGAPTESFRDEGSRVLFDNAAEHTLAHGMAPALPPLAAPRADEGYQRETNHRLAGGMDEVPAGSIRGHVERLTDGVLEGWIMDAANPLVPVEIEIRVEGKPVGRTIANGYRTDLHRAGIGVGRAGFRFVLPTGCDDVRAVSVVRAFDGANLPVAATVTV
jgi:hypothetical protein